MDAIQAAVLNVKIGQLDNWTAGRQKNAKRYREMFRDQGIGGSRVFLPVETSADGEKAGRHIYNQFVIRVPGHRDRLKQHLSERGIGSEIYYPLPLHLQKCFSYLGYARGDLPESEAAANVAYLRQMLAQKGDWKKMGRAYTAPGAGS